MTFMKMEPSFCTAVFWRGGEKIDLNGLKPDAVRCLSVTGERKVNLSFLRDYPNLEELALMEKCAVIFPVVEPNPMVIKSRKSLLQYKYPIPLD